MFIRKFLPAKITLLITGSAVAATEVEELVITGVRDTSVLVTEDTLVAPADTAQLLGRIPGANVNKNGELTGIPQYRGMYGDRVNVNINGTAITGGGPNAMDTPLHFAPVAILESLTVHRGITPVSLGQETIGGSMQANTYRGDFGLSQDFSISGRIYAGGQSVSDGSVLSTLLSLANESHLFSLSLMDENGDDSDFGAGRITPSSYARQRLDLGYGFHSDQQELRIDYSRNETGDAGTAALPMDIQSVDSDQYRASHAWQGSSYTLSTEFSWNAIEHWMSNHHLRRPPQGDAMTPGTMLYRSTFASSDNGGFTIKLEQPIANGLRRIGIDGHFSDHDAAVSNPEAPMFSITNFRDVKRNILGLFVEQEMELGQRTGLSLGLRYNRVSMDAGRVEANLNPMNLDNGMPVMMNGMAAQLASAFNSSNRARHDDNLDWFARFSLESHSYLTWYAGLARKSRSPSYQERYLWLPLEATGGLADGLTYIGDIDLSPEVAHEAELGFDWDGTHLSFYPRLFYRQVDDYIQGTPADNALAGRFAGMMGNMGMGSGELLQYRNVDARLYGLDLESSLQLTRRLTLNANLSLVRGERRDLDDPLYRIAADNLMLTLQYTGERWSASLESVSYADQEKVSTTNQEQSTGGYSLINAHWRLLTGKGLEFGLGVNNLLDRDYRDHLAGYNRAYNPDLALRERLPGLGRNIYARVIWTF